MLIRRIAILLPIVLTTAGLVTPGPVWGCFMRAPLPVQVSADHIEVEITDQVAVKTYHCVFHNPNPQAIVGGECYMEVEPGAQVDGLVLEVEGREVEAEILEATKANRVFEEIVRSGGSPALLEFYGSQLIRSKVPSVPAGGKVTVKLRYTTVLSRENGLFRIQLLNTNPKVLQQTLEKASVRVKIRVAEGVTNVFSPTHPIVVAESPDADVVVEWEEANYLPRTPFVLYWAAGGEPVGASLWAHREPGQDAGTFMLRLAPNSTQVSDLSPVAKDIVFCLDTSGSMAKDGLIDQAREALAHAIRSLSERDRFDVVTFGTEARSFADGALVPATADARKDALARIAKIGARGGTALLEALDVAFSRFEGDRGNRVRILILMSDGRPTIGEREPDTILARYRKVREAGVRVHAFGVGPEVNAYLVDALASEHRGESAYILPGEKIDAKVAPFLDRIGSAVVTDLAVRFEGIEVSEVYPKTLPDLALGGEITLFGRFEGAGEASIVVTGRAGDQKLEFASDITFPDEELRSSFVPRLWAGQKVAYLLGELREKGNEPELVDEVVRLAKLHGIVTPYTSYLLAPDGENMAPAIARIRIESQLSAWGDYAQSTGSLGWQSQMNELGNAERFRYYRTNSALASGAFLADRAQDEYAALGNSGSVLSRLVYAGDRTFYNTNGVWNDSRYDAMRDRGRLRRIRAGSDEYFALLAQDPSRGKILSLGNVVFEANGEFCEVVLE